MNMKKPLSAALLTGGLILGSFGTASIASAQYGDDAPSEPTVEDVTAEDVNSDIEALSIQLADDDATEPAEGENEGRRGKRGCGEKHEAAAEAIGITVEELRDARADGDTVAEIAVANGSSADAVIDALVDDAQERIDAKVADGDLTEEEAAEKLADKAERIEEKVFAEPGERGDRGNRNADQGEDI